MENKKTNRWCLLAGILCLLIATCLTVQSVLWFIRASVNYFNFHNLLLLIGYYSIRCLRFRYHSLEVINGIIPMYPICYIAVTVGLFAKKRELIVGGLCTVSVMSFLLWFMCEPEVTSLLPISILHVVGTTFLILALLPSDTNYDKRKNMVFSILSGLSIALCGIYLIICIYNPSLYPRETVDEWIRRLPPTILYFLILGSAHACIGIASKDFPALHRCVNPIQKRATANEPPIARIADLKKLLDAGTITQDEFDEKKKEILNSSN